MKSGLDIIGDVPWGTHFCQFYQTKDDLLEILPPYFKAGLENNEFGMWVTADPLTPADAREAMAKAMPDFASYLEKGRIEILPHTEWYLKGGSFNLNRVLDGWVSKLDQATAQGCSGMRVTGNTAWLERSDWDGFAEYEAAINGVIGKYNMMALCTYWLDKCSATDVMDVIRNHEFALIRKGSRWEVIENAAYKQAQQALLESERKYRDLMESLQEGVWVVDKEMRTAFVNPHMAAMLGYAVAEMMGKPLFSFIDESNLSLARERMERRWQGVKEQVEFEFRRKDGSPLHVIINATPLTDHLGNFSGVIAGIVDITERKRFEESLRESEERYRRIVETAQEGIIIGSPENRFVFVNQRMADMLGYAREEMVGKTGLDFMDADQKYQVTSFRKRLKEGQVVHDEYKWRRKDGSTMWTLCSASGIYDEVGRHLGNVAMHNDITERKLLEQKLAYLASFPEINPLPVVEIDRLGTVEYINPAARQLFPDLAEKSNRHPYLEGLAQLMRSRRLLGSGHMTREVKVGERYYEQVLYAVEDVQHIRIYGRDVTEHRQMEEDLRRSEERLKKAQEIAHLGSWDLDLRNNRLFWSDEVYRIFGLQPQEFSATYEAFLDAVHPDDRAAVDNAYSNSLRQGRDEYEIEHRVVRKSNGEIRFVHEKCKHIRDGSGQVIRSVGMVHDITERKQAEEALLKSREELRLLADFTYDWESWIDQNRNYLYVSPSCERITGYRAEEFLRDPDLMARLVLPEDWAIFDNHRQSSLVESAGPAEIDFRIQSRTGEIRWISHYCQSVFGSDGIWLGRRASNRDITERKQAEEALRQARDYLDNLLNYANAPIIVWDPAFRITRFNHAFERLTGRKAGEVLGKQLDILFPKQSRERSLTHIYRAVAGERWEVQEIPILHVDGTVRTVLWNSANLYASDGRTVVATIAQGQDITERKEAEEEIKILNEILKARAQALEAANTELEAFSYSVSHDLRGPLRSMDGFSLALLEDYGDKLDAQAKDLLQRIRAASQFMAELIDGILTLSRVTRTEIRWQRVNLSELAESIASELQGTQPERQVEFIIKPGVSAYGDATLLRLVVRNLLDNAWKFTGKVSCPRIEFGVARRGSQTVYFVRDNGAGFDMAYADKLFTPFQRLHSEDDFAGTGIGLATLRRIINRHGGRIWGESEVGKGATFYFTLKRPSRKEIVR